MDAPENWGGLTPPVMDNWFHLGEIVTIPVEFADRPFIQRNSFHLLAGTKGVGKGTWLAHLAARVSRGEFGPDRHVLWLALGEDSYEIDVRPRIEANGGTLDLIYGYNGQMMLPAGADEIQRKAEEIGHVGLIVIDPVSSALSTRTNTEEVRPALVRLNNLAHHLNTIVVASRNFTMKAANRSDGALSAILGSSDFVNIPRAVLGIVNDDVDPDVRHMFVLAGNRVKADTPGIMFRIGGVVPPEGGEEVTKVSMVGESFKDPDELISIRRRRTESKSTVARDMVLEILWNDPTHRIHSDLVDALVAERTGLAAVTVRNVRRDLGPKGAGLIRSVAEKDEDNQFDQWYVVLTEAGKSVMQSRDLGGGTPDHNLGVNWNPPESHVKQSSGAFKPKQSSDMGPDHDLISDPDHASRVSQEQQLPLGPSLPQDLPNWEKGSPPK